MYTDQLGREIELLNLPQRIISAVPSQTELLFFLGLGAEVIGITKFCIHPADKFKTVTKIGGTKQLNIELIKSLRPDLIIANKEENERGQIEELMQSFPVWISDINNLDSALQMINGVGELVGKQTEANDLAVNITRQFTAFKPLELTLKAAYFIWRKPYMVAGTGTFIDDMLLRCGLLNVFKQQRYPEVSREMFIAANPDMVLLSSEPYPFGQKHINEFKAILPNANVQLVDGEMFSWYGNRLLHAPGYFNQLLQDISY